ncbi:MAG: S8 family serine peptidase [Chloroflexi bacterium]|nr:S8 family serine peptidase [Chloroflexota bacterium]
MPRQRLWRLAPLVLLLVLVSSAPQTGAAPAARSAPDPDKAWHRVSAPVDRSVAMTTKLDAQLRLAFHLWSETERLRVPSAAPSAVGPEAEALDAVAMGMAQQIALHLAAPQPGAHVLIQTTDDARELRARGIPVPATIGDVATAYLPFSRLDEVASLPSVVFIAASQLLQPTNDVSVPETQAPQVWSDLGSRGAGVVVGVIDSGIDPFHPDFIRSDGTTRIRYLLDFSDPGDPDSDGDLDGPDFAGGTMYSEAQINAALASPGYFHASADTPKSIPDNSASGVTSQIAVAENVTISAVAVELYVTHPHVGDLKVTLTCPSGNKTTLRSRSGGDRYDLIGTFTTTACNGQSMQGNWRLTVSDHAWGNSGTLVFWNLHLNRSLRMTDQVGHGTHVAGSAAGNGRATGGGLPAGTFKGMAPQAQLIAVRVARDYIGAFSSSDVVNALAFIDQKAHELGLPYVANMSLTGHLGPHDGTSLHEQAIDDLVGAGKRGKAVVVAAGNEGDEHIHASGTVPQNGTNELCFQNPSVTLALMDVWYPGSDTLGIGFRDPTGAGLDPVPISPGDDGCYASGSNVICVESSANDPYNGDKEIFLLVYAAIPGQWRFILHGDAVTSGHFDAWIQGTEFSCHVDDRLRVGMPGTARQAITVGAYTTKNQWTDANGALRSVQATVGDRAAFSSDGPTRDGRRKPDISAPGQMICSALSSQSPVGGYGAMYPSAAYVCQDGRHGLAAGTSMAAPHVTGAVALLLSLNRDLDVRQLKDALTGQARSDSFTGNVPNNRWGHGKLDVLAAARAVSPPTPTSTPTPTPTATPTPTSTPTSTPPPTPTPTPTPTPIGPWLSWRDPNVPLLLTFRGAAAEVSHGNIPVPATLTAALSGPALFADGSQELAVGVATSDGSYTFYLKPAAGAALGDAFTLEVTLSDLELPRLGAIARELYVPLIFREAL